MGWGTRLYWVLLAVLSAAALFFGVNAEGRRRSVQRGETKLDNDAIVRLERVVDGDTLLVTTEEDQSVAVRLVGIKAFDEQRAKDAVRALAARTVLELERLLADQPIQLVLHDVPQDAHGRTLAYLYVDGEDVGLSLVQDGLVLVYPVYPFARLPLYQVEQEAARADRRGLWANEDIVEHANLLLRQWGKEVR